MEIDLSKKRREKGKRARAGKRLSGAFDFAALKGDKKPVNVGPRGNERPSGSWRGSRFTLSSFKYSVNNVKRAFSQALYWGRGSGYRWIVQGAFVVLILAFFLPYASSEEAVVGAASVEEEEIHFDFGGDVLASDIMYEFSGGQTVIPDDRPEYNVRTYVVQSGDTLSSIATKFDLSVDTLRWANSIYSDTIKPGQKLKVPPVDGVLYEVEKGDSLASIAEEYDMEGGDQTILDWNLQLEEPYTLETGMVLFIPGAEGETPQPPVASTSSSSSSSSGSPYTSSSGGVSAPANAGQFIEPVAGGVGWQSRGYYSYHRAVDITARGAPDIVATASGRVIYSGYKSGGCGYGVWVDHGNGFVSHYCHMSSLYVRSGASVSQGTRIGRMGSTGRSTGVHVHFVLEYKGVPIDPRRYVSI